MKIIVRLILAISLMLIGAFLNEAYRSQVKHQAAIDEAPKVENSFELNPTTPEMERTEQSQPAPAGAAAQASPNLDVLRLRGETAGLKSQVASLKKDRDEMLARKSLERRLGRAELKLAEIPGEPFQRNTYYRTDLVRDVGNDTAPAALQSFVAAIARGDYQAAIKLSPNDAQGRLQGLMDNQLLGKFTTSESQGIKIETYSETDHESEFVAEIDFGEDKPPVRAHFYTTNELGAWKVLPRVAVEGSMAHP